MAADLWPRAGARSLDVAVPGAGPLWQAKAGRVGPTTGQLEPARGAYALPRIPHLRLRFSLRSLGHARLPPYKGSLLRGAFGHALRKAVCAMGPAQACGACRLRRACVYTRLFETFIDGEPPPFLRGLDTSPRPYVFEPCSQEQDFPPGAGFDFDLVLVGQAIELQAYVVLAVERMVGAGLGRDRHRFSLDRVRSLDTAGEWQEVGAAGNGTSAMKAAGAAVTGMLPPPAAVTPSRAELRFLTSTRIKVRDHLAPAIGLRDLAFSMLRRSLELAHFHVPAATIDWNFRQVLDDASAARVVAQDFRWQDWQRYSNRQQAKMTLGGFVGSIAIEGDLSSLWPLFRTAEVADPLDRLFRASAEVSLQTRSKGRGRPARGVPRPVLAASLLVAFDDRRSPLLRPPKRRRIMGLQCLGRHET
jgi:hypothetical protein